MRSVGFVLIPVLSAGAPLLVIPAIAHTRGSGAWATIAIGIAVGSAVAVMADLGWTVVGPQRIARAPERAEELYRRATATRVLALACLLPIGAFGAAILAPGDALAASVVTIGVGAGALSPTWYLVGLSRPWTILLLETAPRVLASAGAAGIILLGGPTESYGAALAAAAAVSIGGASLLPGLGSGFPGADDFRAAPVVIRELRVLVLGRTVSTAATVLPTAILGVVMPECVAAFAALDRPVRMGLQVLQAVPTRMQSWLGQVDGPERTRRVRLALLSNALLGVLAGCTSLALMAPALSVLFGASVAVPGSAVLAAAGLVAVICTSRGAGLAVVALERPAATTAAAVVTAGLAVVGVIVGAVTSGVTGAVIGVTVAEAAGVVVQLAAIGRNRVVMTPASI